MRFLYFSLIFLISFNARSSCPDLSKNESSVDCPWADITRQIVDQSKTCNKVLKTNIPFIIDQMNKDKKSSMFLSMWGEAKNFDENAVSTIVDLKILKCLSEKLKLKNSIKKQHGFDSIHAGLQHTYAYLFSNLQTPYGYKRARWVNDDLQKGFGLTKNSLTPMTAKGAFLSNVTYFFAKFAFKEDIKLIKKLETYGLKNKSVSPELISINPENFEIKELKESLPQKQVIIHTTFVKMNSEKVTSKNTHLLIYWVENQKNKTKFLVTGFPVEQSFVNKIFDEKNIGLNKSIITRYNAWISDLANSREALIGLREVAK